MAKSLRGNLNPYFYIKFSQIQTRNKWKYFKGLFTYDVTQNRGSNPRTEYRVSQKSFCIAILFCCFFRLEISISSLSTQMQRTGKLIQSDGKIFRQSNKSCFVLNDWTLVLLNSIIWPPCWSFPFFYAVFKKKNPLWYNIEYITV